MADIIQEMAVVNAAKSSNPAVFNQYEIEPTDFIFKKYEVDSLQFVASDRYYISRPDQYKNIYKIIEKRIETKAKEMTKAKNEKDSITRLEKVKKAKERSGKKRANKNAPQ